MTSIGLDWKVCVANGIDRPFTPCREVVGSSRKVYRGEYRESKGAGQLTGLL